MKKTICGLLIVLALALTACNGNPISTDSKTDSQTPSGTKTPGSSSAQVDDTVPKKDLSIKEGNSLSNLNNLGGKVDCGDWIVMNWIGVAKIRPDGTGQAKLFSGSAYSMNIIGDTMYYLKESYGVQDVYTIKTDGTGETKIDGVKASWIYVLDETLYYADGSSIGKCNLDGSGKTVLISEKAVMSYNIGENGIYFIDGDYKPWQANADGSNVRRLGEETASKMALSDDRLYFLNPSRGSSVWSMKTDGSDPKQVVSGECAELLVEGDMVYYVTTQDKKLYSAKADGSGEPKLLYGDEEISGIALVGELVIGTGNMKCLFVNKDGSGAKVIEREY